MNIYYTSRKGKRLISQLQTFQKEIAYNLKKKLSQNKELSNKKALNPK
jgi:hypothetical protein